MLEYISLLEPLMPISNRELVDLATELIETAQRLNHSVHPVLRIELGKLVRSMNCYYSNLIEGHKTLPIDIEKALNNNFVDDERVKNLQLEAIAHIKVQEKIDLDLGVEKAMTQERIRWIHREFSSHLPLAMLEVANQEQTKVVKITPGEYRTGKVIVGKHIPVSAAAIATFLARFEQGYNWDKLSKIDAVIAAAASHHRLLWIHPFYDGNGRVSRLFSHGYLREIGIGNSLWSVARGLARNQEEYKKNLALADSSRWNDLDGRGNLTNKGLVCLLYTSDAADEEL
jgi:Fic family protein